MEHSENLIHESYVQMAPDYHQDQKDKYFDLI